MCTQAQLIGSAFSRDTRLSFLGWSCLFRKGLEGEDTSHVYCVCVRWLTGVWICLCVGIYSKQHKKKPSYTNRKKSAKYYALDFKDKILRIYINPVDPLRACGSPLHFSASFRAVVCLCYTVKAGIANCTLPPFLLGLSLRYNKSGVSCLLYYDGKTGNRFSVKKAVGVGWGGGRDSSSIPFKVYIPSEIRLVC